MEDPVFGEAGAALWATLSEGLVLRADEAVLLTEACLVADRIAEMEAALGDAEIMAIGSMGQPVVHPLIREIRAQRAQQAHLVRSIHWPDDAAGCDDRAERSAQARERALRRWHGKTAAG